MVVINTKAAMMSQDSDYNYDGKIMHHKSTAK